MSSLPISMSNPGRIGPLAPARAKLAAAARCAPCPPRAGRCGGCCRATPAAPSRARSRGWSGTRPADRRPAPRAAASCRRSTRRSARSRSAARSRSRSRAMRSTMKRCPGARVEDHQRRAAPSRNSASNSAASSLASRRGHDRRVADDDASRRSPRNAWPRLTVTAIAAVAFLAVERRADVDPDRPERRIIAQRRSPRPTANCSKLGHAVRWSACRRRGTARSRNCRRTRFRRIRASSPNSARLRPPIGSPSTSRGPSR